MSVPLFELGRLVATPGALALLASAGQDPAELLDRHLAGDWGEVPPEDARENKLSVREGFRILSSYPVGGAGEKVDVQRDHVEAHDLMHLSLREEPIGDSTLIEDLDGA